MFMEQRDYLLREIEKIGALLKMIFNKITHKDENNAITSERKLQESKEMLLKEVGIDIDKFLSFDESEIKQYMSQFDGFNVSNIEYLADILNELGMDSSITKEYLKKALKLYELCNSLDKTFSFERERKIDELKNTLIS